MLQNKKLFLFDIDGVIKLSDIIIDGSLQLYKSIKEKGGKSIFITNNSTKSTKDYVVSFKKYGFLDVDESNFVTALTVSVLYLKKHCGNKLIFVVGTNSFKNELINNGLNVTDNLNNINEIQYVIVGFDNELTFDKICNVCKILQTKNVEYFATNLDLKCPTDFGFIPDCGAICDMIKTATDKTPKFLGKPSPDMVNMSMENTGFTPEETIVVGDRFYTDIACGINAGVDTCVVFTGEAKPEHIAETKYKPTYQFPTIKNLWKEYIRK